MIIYSTNKVSLRCVVNNITLNSLLDTGAGKSFMDIGTVEKLKLNTGVQQSDDILYDVSGRTTVLYTQ